MEQMTIGQVANRAEVGVETVRYYERQGLIEEPPRKAGGYRQYSTEAVKRIFFIKRAKELGFSLKDIKELLTLRLDPSAKCEDVRRQGLGKIAQIEGKIDTLNRMKNALEKLTAVCSGQEPVSNCPILEALEPSKENNV